MTAPTPAGEEGEAYEAARRIVDKHDRRDADMRRQYPGSKPPKPTDALIVARALLSSPRVERERALEEAAKVAEEFAESHRNPPSHNDTFWTAMNLAKAIRALKETKP